MKPGVDPRARRDRSGARADLPRSRPGAVVAPRRRLRRARQPPRASAGGSSTCSRRTRRYADVFLAAARRAPGRQRRGRARPRPSASSAARSTRRSWRDAFRAVRSPGRLEVVGHQPLVLLDGANNVAGAARAAGRARPRSSPSRRARWSIGLLREKEPHEMLDALGATATRRGSSCCRPAEPACARPGVGRGRRRRRSESIRGRIEIVDTRRRRRRPRSRSRRRGRRRSSSPARCTWSAPPARVLVDGE